MKWLHRAMWAVVCVCGVGFVLPARAEVMLQWFETDWDEMYQKLPLVAQIGYDSLWIPPPTKGPTGKSVKWSNVGYNLYDRFDLGDVPQRGTLDTRYGTRGSLRAMVDNAHGLGIKIIPDIVMNHNGNGPDFREYPGMTATDFHVEWSEGYCNTLNYKRARRMDQWYHNEGYGGTMWQDLANLVDIRTEDHPLNPDPKRFTGQKTIEGHSFNFVDGTSFIRHVGQYDRYPYEYKAENSAEMLYRWIAWLGNAMDYDGLRLDAGKHTPWEFFGTRGSGFLHEAQWNYAERRGYGFNANVTDLFANDRDRTNALIFAEILSPWSEIEYWYGQGKRNPMRFLDYQIKKTADACFTGNMSGLGQYGSDFGPSTGIMYVWGHDEALATGAKANLAYAYILSHIGYPMVYYTGNNISWEDHGRDPSKKTWMIPGYDTHALGEHSDPTSIPNMVWINQNFARGSEVNRWKEDSNFHALERYDDLNGNGSADSGEGIVIVALNGSGNDITHELSCSFPNGTVLKDYTGHNPDLVTVANGKATIRVPGNYGQGWVAYAPLCADGVTLAVKQGGAAAPTMAWVIPGGVHANDTTQQITRITADTITIEAEATQIPSGVTVDNIMLKWGDGKHLAVTNFFDEGRGVVSGRFHNMNRPASGGTYSLTFSTTNLTEGLHSIKVRAFTQRTAGQSAIFNTQTKVVYVDRRGPDLELDVPDTIMGDAVLTIRNPDFTALKMFVKVDNGSEVEADCVMKGLYRAALTGLSAGSHTVTVRAEEYNYANPRTKINESTTSKTIQVQARTKAMTLDVICPDLNPNDDVVELPFFKTAGTGATDIRLYWDGYELPWNSGNYTNTFNGEIIQRDDTHVVTNHLWGNFINGVHFFELKSGNETVVKRVVFNLYGVNAIDSDGDGIPDNVEMPYFDQGAPGPDVSWPGDSNNNFIPEWGENWTRLNPYNHSTFYSGQWDDQLDMDGDGFTMYEEVYAGYLEGNIYKYDPYNASSKPDGLPSKLPSSCAFSPSLAVRDSTLTITYTPNQGALESVNQVVAHIGHSKRSTGSWQDVIDVPMTRSGDNWVYNYQVPSTATSVEVTFFDGAAIWDGRDWQCGVYGVVDAHMFTMDGELDSAAFKIAEGNMNLWAAVRGSKLYVATWGVGGNGNDHCIYVSDSLGDASEIMPGWNKQGKIFLDTANKPFLAGEGENGWCGWFNAPASSVCANAKSSSTANYMEGELDLYDTFGTIPKAIYVAVGAFETWDEGGLAAQSPPVWDGGDSNIDLMEIIRVPVASITDNTMDGNFDMGSPVMTTTVNDNEENANYNIRRFFLNELAGDMEYVSVSLWPNAGGTNVVTDVELFSNLNRREFVKLPGEENPDTVTPTSIDTYYMAYPMKNAGGGKYTVSLPIYCCGAYRINARWRVNGGSWVYYTDHGLRRDCAVIVTPKKALETIIYELNPMTAKATSAEFSGRSTFSDMIQTAAGRADVVSTNALKNLGVNMVWLQPIHPIGTVGRDIDPITSQAYDPGSPYAVRNYWQVNPVLGSANTSANAMTEFTNFVAAYNQAGIGVMLDGTFNHSAWDCEVGEMGVQMGVSRNASDLIASVRPGWYSKKDSYGEPASYYGGSTNNTDIAVAPDRIDFGKWADAADFFFGRYDALVQYPASNSSDSWSSQWNYRFLREDDLFEGFTASGTQELWEYFSNYPIYWLEKTGHPAGTPKTESWKGIDGLRCDFAQGLPNLFWEYTINKTRNVKWDFLFMAESLDGYRTVDGSKRHGVGYRSSRHFDILNENMLYLWRDTFFSYRVYPDTGLNPQKFTWNIYNAFNDRKQAFDMSPILLNLTGHDEVIPTDDQWSLIYAYAVNSAMDGVPMVFYGQEAGAQNDAGEYGVRTDYGIDSANNFRYYESNFGKSIPNFKRYNHMTNIWNGVGSGSWKDSMRDTYARLNNVRQKSPALRSQQNYFLSDKSTTNQNADITAIAKFQKPGVPVSQQDVVIVFVNNNFRDNDSRAASFMLNATTGSGANWFGIEASHMYNAVDIASATPAYLWGSTGMSGADLIANGIYVGFQSGQSFSGGQAQYIRLIDTTAGMTIDSINDYDFNSGAFPAPIITVVPNDTVQVGNEYTLTLEVTKDPADTVVLFCRSALPQDSWSFDAATGDFLFVPTEDETGEHTFVFQAIGQNGLDEMMLTLIVIPGDLPPEEVEVIGWILSGNSLQATLSADVSVGGNVWGADSVISNQWNWSRLTDGYTIGTSSEGPTVTIEPTLPMQVISIGTPEGVTE